MRPFHLLVTGLGLLSITTCARPHSTEPPATDPAPLGERPQVEAVLAATDSAGVPVAYTSKPTHYCHVYPQNCRPCTGNCGPAQPMGGACCCPSGGGCEAVALASDCDTGCDFWPCTYGYQGESPDGVPYVICNDPPDD
jgi:hypothetical protein